MGHRIFIAINLPDDIKKRLVFHQSKWPELPIRWTKKENLHITLVFIGYVNDQELIEICKIVEKVAVRNSSLSLNLNKICYGPPKKIPPRMVWAEGEKSEELGKLQNDLENSLSGSEVKIMKESEARPYAPHITLGRIKQWEFRKIEPEERPVVEEEISLNFPVQSIEVMESELKRGGAEYTILESYSLKA